MSRYRRKIPAPDISSRPAWPATPSAPTFYRLTTLQEQGRRLVNEAAARVTPEVWERDGATIERIQRAASLEALLDLAPEASGLAENAWYERARRLGLGLAPRLGDRLRATGSMPDEHHRDIARERLIMALRWQGPAGAQALQAAFPELDDYGRSLASMALGLLGAQASAGLIRNFFQAVRRRPETSFVGALWGLIDLQDPQASPALVQLLADRRPFFELHGFLALAGRAEAVGPLLRHLARLTDRRPPEPAPVEEAGVALSAIGHRLGREALLAEMTRLGPEVQPAEWARLADQLLGRPLDSIHAYFRIFFRGLSAADLQAPDDLDQEADDA